MKAIKFNLSYGNERIKTLAELKENCNIDMLLETLQNGLLVRWLTAQGEADLAKKVGAIDKSDYRKITKELLKVLFSAEAGVYEQAAAELFAMREKETKRLETLCDLAGKENEIIKQYHKGYDDMLESLKANKNDYPALKANMATLYAQYRGLLLLDKKRFYDTFKDGYPLVLLALMANQQLCECFFTSADEVRQVYDDIIPQLQIDQMIKKIKLRVNHGEESPAVEIETEEQLQRFKAENEGKMFLRFAKSSPGYNDSICHTVQNFNLGDYYVPYEALLAPHIKFFKGKTDAYWKDLEPKGKTFMIISIQSGNKLRNAGANGEEFSVDDINGKFIFTDGIDYMSNSDTDKLIYMEV